MPRTTRIPAYRLHKPSGQARVIIDGRHVYLGLYGSPKSREQYARAIAERFSSQRELPTPVEGGSRFPELSVNEVVLRYMEFASTYYTKDGQPTGEVNNVRDAVRPLCALYGHTHAGHFGPKSLKALQGYMIQVENLSRRVINARINRIRRIFKWAVSEELIDPKIHEGLRSISGLRRGRSGARETAPIRPVPDEWVDATLKFLSPVVADMVRVQRLTGMRPGSVTIMRGCDIDTSGRTWFYTPLDHKTRYLDRDLRVPIGPKARVIIRRYLRRSPQAFLFSPVEADEWRRKQRAAHPKPGRTAVYPCEVKRLAQEKAARRLRKRKRPLRDHYDTDTYYRAVQYAINKANKNGVTVPAWHPNQLRHSRATEVRRAYGIEGAQVVLGQARADVTQVYAERDTRLAEEIARKTG